VLVARERDLVEVTLTSAAEVRGCPPAHARRELQQVCDESMGTRPIGVASLVARSISVEHALEERIEQLLLPPYTVLGRRFRVCAVADLEPASSDEKMTDEQVTELPSRGTRGSRARRG